MGKFTAEEIQIAKAVDLVDLAEQIGIPLKRKGRFYQAVGMDSVMIFNRSSWCRFSQGVGGSTIDFLEYFRNMDLWRQSNICWSLPDISVLKPCKNFNRKDRLKNRRNKTEKRHTERPFCTSFKIRNQPPVIWLSDKTAEAVKADD